MITADEIMNQVRSLEEELMIEPRKDVARRLGASSDVVDTINSNTVIIISGCHRDGLPNFIRFSPLLEKDKYIIMNEPEMVSMFNKRIMK